MARRSTQVVFASMLAFAAVVAALVSDAPLTGAASACAEAVVGDVPLWADRSGVPFAVRLTLPGCMAGDEEIRAWVGTSSDAASRLWDGASWASPTRYAPLSAMARDDAGRVIVAMRADTGADPPVDIPSDVWVRVRDGAGATTLVRVGALTWSGSLAVSSAWVEPGAGWAAAVDGGSIVAAAPLGFDGEGRVAPPGFATIARPTDAAVDRSAPAPVSAGDVLFVRVAPSLLPAGVEGLVLHIDDDVVLSSLAGLRVTDGEGDLVLGAVAASPGGLVVLRDSLEVGLMGAPGNATVLDWTDPAGNVTASGRFALADGGDGVIAYYGDILLDAFVYGDSAPVSGWDGAAAESYRIQGRLLSRVTDDAGFIDTDTAADWSAPRIYRQHQSDRETRWSDAAGPVRAFVCPDRCLEEVLLRVDAARTTLDVNLYDLTLYEAVEAFARAAERGVDVRVLLQGRPVGADADKLERTAWAVERLRGSGADVRTLERLRFDHDHAKYLIVDGKWTVVLSENANGHGWPADGATGNRGWGVAVRDVPLAAWMTGLFDADHGHPLDSRPLTGADLDPEARTPVWAGVTMAPDRLPTLVVAGPVRVMPVVAPDHLGDPVTSPLVAALANASSEVWTQQLNLPFLWRRDGYEAESPLVRAMMDAMGRGVAVRGVLSGDFLDGNASTAGNDETAAFLSRLAEMGRDPMWAPVRLGSGPGGVLHNKGWLIDPGTAGGIAVVGSANGNLASQVLNREVTLFLSHPDVTAYYRDVLAADLEKATVPPGLVRADGTSSGRDTPAPTFAVVLLVLALAASLRRRTPSGPFL